MEEQEFFKQMLEKTKEVFHKSKTFEKYPNENWNYAVCDTPIQKGTGIIFGLNWGGADINVQTEYPEVDKDRNWPFITHSKWYLKEFLNSTIDELNYTNLSFFRSPRVRQIAESDWEASILLFKDYVNFIIPPWAIMLGKPSHLWNDHVTQKSIIEQVDEKNNKTFYGYNGILFNKYPFAALPHPQAHISSATRRNIWKEVITKNELFKKT